MIEVYPRLFIGDESDYERTVSHQGGWWTVHACKEPYHRQLLGYKTRGAPKNHPEYFFARRTARLFLNLVEAPDPNYIPKVIVDEALCFIDEGLQQGERVLIHCNQGESRSPSIGLLYLVARTATLPKGSLSEAETPFRKLYPLYNPSSGMRGFLIQYWNDYVHPSAGV
ncbi:MAG: dual specificity protein phosphatase [Candidatus Hydrogenedentes bacterium]|nr:dual specificity protein phosphatase [Candidatus Hydrogenedentota bacterium]